MHQLQECVNYVRAGLRQANLINLIRQVTAGFESLGTNVDV